MSKPIIADNKPIKVNLTEGQEYYFCRCGRSKNQPYCDGSHSGTGFKPMNFTAEKDEEAYLCQCKHTSNAPFCDGTHKRFSSEQVGKEGPEKKREKSDKPTASATQEEPTLEFIHQLAREGLSKLGHHGPMAAMGVPRHLLPHWDAIQIMVAQMATQPLLEDVPVSTELIVGPNARKPLKLAIPLLVSDMSFGALSEEAKIALAKGAELAGTGICSGEGGCYLKNKLQIRGISMSLPVLSLATMNLSFLMFRLFILKVGRAPKQARVVIFQQIKMWVRSLR